MAFANDALLSTTRRLCANRRYFFSSLHNSNTFGKKNSIITMRDDGKKNDVDNEIES